MRSSAVGPDRAVDRSSAPPPRAANLYACHEVMGATACRPFRVNRVALAMSAAFPLIPNSGAIADIAALRVRAQKPTLRTDDGRGPHGCY